VPLAAGETLGFTPGRGYYAIKKSLPAGVALNSTQPIPAHQAAPQSSTPEVRVQPSAAGTSIPRAAGIAMGTSARQLLAVPRDGTPIAKAGEFHELTYRQPQSIPSDSAVVAYAQPAKSTPPAAAKTPVHYVNPFAGAKIVPERTDQGVDFRGIGPIRAIGDAKIVAVDGTGSGWPGGSGEIGYYILYQLQSGPYAGRYVYVAEAVNPAVRVGQQVKAGSVIARFGQGAAPASSGPGIETGWGSPTPNVTYSRATVGPYDDVGPTAAGEAFARLLMSVGVHVEEPPGKGPQFPG
jgi:murein DD-endopeptidase MepM/ murein hydrolase activator NlpD